MSDDEDDPRYVWGRRRRRKEATDGDGDNYDSLIEREKAVAIAKTRRDLMEMEVPACVQLFIDSPLAFRLVINPDSGFWYGGSFEFSFKIPETYPFAAPIVTCIDPIWHPNIDLDGKPCLNVLQIGWKPTYTLQTVMYGLLFLFSDPNPIDGLNIEAAEELRVNPQHFRQQVIATLRGGVTIGSVVFPPNRLGDPSKYGLTPSSREQIPAGNVHPLSPSPPP